MIPRCDPITQTLSLEATAGTDSKTSGSYCTPTELVELVLDTALDNVLDDVEKQPDPEAALLGMTACDPAIGSGHLSRYRTPHRQLACHGFVRVRSTRPQTMLQDADARRGRWLYQTVWTSTRTLLVWDVDFGLGFIRLAPTFSKVEMARTLVSTSRGTGRRSSTPPGELQRLHDQQRRTTLRSRVHQGARPAAATPNGRQHPTSTPHHPASPESAPPRVTGLDRQRQNRRLKPCSGFKPLATKRRCPHD